MVKSEEIDIYEESRRVWDLRYGGYIKSRNLWRIVALITSGIAFVSVCGIAYIGSQSKFIPYIVEVDKLGKSAAIRPVKKITRINERVVQSVLASFVVNLRTVSVDINSINVSLEKLYSHINREDPAFSKVTKYMKSSEGDPYSKAQKMVVSVAIKNVLKISDNSWRIEWIEESNERNGDLIGVKKYQAIATIIIVPSEIENDKYFSLLNPLGIYVRDLSWQEELK